MNLKLLTDFWCEQKFKNYLSVICFMKMMKMIIAQGKEVEDEEHPVEKDIEKYDCYLFQIYHRYHNECRIYIR